MQLLFQQPSDHISNWEATIEIPPLLLVNEPQGGPSKRSFGLGDELLSSMSVLALLGNRMYSGCSGAKYDNQ
ncbi:MAG TPA: hypothetical protein D7I06_01135 [Candidatus Poseidoniales archaeon]|nr:MAG TPA: hypothetical protein D7I06_01135 [Candidatus Poseidoniales archaeon]